jgi:sugar lactone lactonase YvrE/predicted alpha/beta superfamily hydrolase
MKSHAALFLVLALACPMLPAQKPAEPDFPLTEDSKPHDGVPKGELIKFTFGKSKIFPGTLRDVTVYVPKQYDPAKPACVYVGQDGVGFNAPVVFDNLIHKREMPVTVGVFIMHGRVKAADPEKALDRFNRSFEYDGLGDSYARFVLEEIFPEVEKMKAGDGRPIHLSKNATDRTIGGSSSGAICAFTAAWERPDAFSRVFSVVGTYVGLRGGDGYPTLIRKFEPKPIRVFLQDGSNDNNIYAGDWWMANQTMQRALEWAGYEVRHVWGEGRHSGRHGAMILPDAMRWLWKGWPELPKNSGTKNTMMNDILIPGEGWQLVWEGGKFTEGPAANAQGEVFFNDIPNEKTWCIGLDGKVTLFASETQRANGQAFSPDGRLHAVAMGAAQVVAYSAEARRNTVAGDIAGNDIVIAHNGNIYVTNPSRDNTPSDVWLIKPDGTKKIVDTGLKFSNGIALSPDQTLLYVADSRSHWIYSYQVKADGTLAHKQRFYWLHMPDTGDDSGADGMCVDRDGRLYVATKMGIQVCDQAGRVNCILPTPNGRVSNVEFGGPAHDTLFATCGDKVFKRKLKARGADSFDAPVKPAAPKL